MQLGQSIISLMETFHLTMGVHTPIFQFDYSIELKKNFILSGNYTGIHGRDRIAH